MKEQYDIPILYIVFNRLEVVKKTFLAIKELKPAQLFIGCDGPRTKEEKEKTDAVRKYILDNINWKCKIKTLFRDKNLGCKHAVTGAIDWFFENVEHGIILEDDCLPNQSFFKFCGEMLLRYKDNKKIFTINGQNMLGKSDIKESYLFSKYFFCWGWASWKDRWNSRSYLKDLSKKDLHKMFPVFFERLIYKKRLKDLQRNKNSSWALDFSLFSFEKQTLSIVPKQNLVENLGFEEESTSNFEKIDKKFLHKKRRPLLFPLNHPKNVKRNKKFDSLFLKESFKRIFFKRVINIFK